MYCLEFCFKGYISCVFKNLIFKSQTKANMITLWDYGICNEQWPSTLPQNAAYQIGTDGTSISQDGPNRKAADAFDLGGGHVNPNKAVDPGLIYNLSTDDYVQFLCSMGYSSASITSLTKNTIDCVEKSHFVLDLNLPSITIPNLKKTVTVTRKVTNVGHFTSVYKVTVEAPYGIEMKVKPQTLSFNSTTQILSFEVTFSSTQKLYGDYKFGSLTWTDGKHLVRIPIAVRPSNLDHIYGNV